jgi:Zn-dependent protease with chaperone function
MKNFFTIDRILIIIIIICFCVILATNNQIKSYTSYIVIGLSIIFLFRVLITMFRRNGLACKRKDIAVDTLKNLAQQMDVKMDASKSLNIEPKFRSAQAISFPFQARFVRVGCNILCGLDDTGLKCVLAHEVAHIKKNHTLKTLYLFALFIPVIVYSSHINSLPWVYIFLTLFIFGFVTSVISWHHEYEADAIAAKYVGNENMANALEKVSHLINRPGDTLAHPSFAKRISRVSSLKK